MSGRTKRKGSFKSKFMKKEKFSKKSSIFFQKSTLQRFLILSILVLTITFILSINFIPSKVILKEGEVASRDIVAPETIEFIDKEATGKLKEEAVKSTREVYNLNLSIIENVENELEKFFLDIMALRTEYSEYTDGNNVIQGNSDHQLPSSTAPDKDPLEDMTSKYSEKFDRNILLELIHADQSSLEEITKNVRSSIRKIMQQGVKEEDIEEAKKQFVREVSEVSTNTYNATIASEVGKNFIKPSLFLDAEATQKKIQDSIAAVRDVKNIIRKDQIIIRKGEIVTSTHIDQLKLLGLQNPILHVQNIFGLLLVNILFIFLLSLYIKIFIVDLYNNINKLILLSILYCLTVFVAKVAGEISGYLIPIAFGSMLIAITIDSRLALWTTFMLSFNIGFIFLGEINFMIVALIGGIVSVFSIRKATQRSSLTRAGLLIALANVLSIFSLGLVHRYSLQIILENCLWGILSGIISTILTIGVLPFLESIFDISSSFRLMELANPNQPLLKQMLVEAPGTYHHSVIVGNLAETAAEEIGANSLLARVGAYYHDIGKLKRPYFFAENQEAYKNTHDDMEPSLSALVIASHVKDGVEMTKKYRLPKAVIDIINQHHGTGLISYFFHRALQSNESKTTAVNEGNYRYSGPKPQSKEAGIIMLADILEAEARTLNSPTPSRIKNLVQSVISRNLENGQLDDCNLTLRDLNKIKEIFSRILTGMFHNRVEYPDEELINKLKKERIQGESTSKKSTETDNQSNGTKKNIDNGNEMDESEGHQ